MFIHEAVEKAIKRNCSIVRESLSQVRPIDQRRTMPTKAHPYRGWPLYVGNEIYKPKYWTLTPEDLIADDWTLVDASLNEVSEETGG